MNTTMNTGAANLSDAVKTALSALEAIAAEMTVGDRFTNAGQHLLDALPVCRAALSTLQADAAIAAGGAQEPVPGTSEYGSWINKAKQATDCKLSFHRDEFKYLCQFEQELRKVYAKPLPRVAATVPDGDAVFAALDRRAQSYISREAVEDVLIAVRALLAAYNGEKETGDA